MHPTADTNIVINSKGAGRRVLGGVGRTPEALSGSGGDDVAVPRQATREWTLWVVAASCALHVTEEYLGGWQQWARETMGIVMPTARFFFINAVLVAAALLLARVGWRRPSLSLIIPAATLVNAVFFHILPTAAQGRVSPGVYTATLLYVPFSTWAFLGAWRDGVPGRALVVAFAAGALQMAGVILGARWLSGVG